MSDDDITVDDLVTKDQLANFEEKLENLESQLSGDEPDDDGTEFELPDDVVTKDEIPDLVSRHAEMTTKDYFQHLRDDDCDDTECQVAREALGWAPDDDGADDGDDSDEPEADDGDGGADESDDGTTNAAFPDEL